MDLILISESKLKVTLTPEDMKALQLSCDDIDYDSTGTRRAFWSILDEAKQKTGFDAAHSRVFIQIYPSKDGGCELYVTKLSPETGSSLKMTDRSCDSSDRLTLDRAGEFDLKKVRGCAAEFETLSQLTNCCRRLYADGYRGKSYAYCDRSRIKTRYILILDGIADINILREYGNLLDPDIVHIWVAEHCDEIRMSDAVETLRGL